MKKVGSISQAKWDKMYSWEQKQYRDRYFARQRHKAKKEKKEAKQKSFYSECCDVVLMLVDRENVRFRRLNSSWVKRYGGWGASFMVTAKQCNWIVNRYTQGKGMTKRDLNKNFIQGVIYPGGVKTHWTIIKVANGGGLITLARNRP